MYNNSSDKRVVLIAELYCKYLCWLFKYIRFFCYYFVWFLRGKNNTESLVLKIKVQSTYQHAVRYHLHKRRHPLSGSGFHVVLPAHHNAANFDSSGKRCPFTEPSAQAFSLSTEPRKATDGSGLTIEPRLPWTEHARVNLGTRLGSKSFTAPFAKDIRFCFWDAPTYRMK